MSDIIQQFEIAFSYDCYAPFVRLIALAGLAEAEIIATERAVMVPETVRPAYGYLYRRGEAMMRLVEKREYPVPREYTAVMTEVQRLVDHMAAGNL